MPFTEAEREMLRSPQVPRPARLGTAYRSGETGRRVTRRASKESMEKKRGREERHAASSAFGVPRQGELLYYRDFTEEERLELTKPSPAFEEERGFVDLFELRNPTLNAAFDEFRTLHA